MSAVETNPWPSTASLWNSHHWLCDRAAVWLLLVVWRLVVLLISIIDDWNNPAFVLLDAFKADSASSIRRDHEESLPRHQVFDGLSTALAWLTLAGSHCVVVWWRSALVLADVSGSFF